MAFPVPGPTPDTSAMGFVICISFRRAMLFLPRCGAGAITALATGSARRCAQGERSFLSRSVVSSALLHCTGENETGHRLADVDVRKPDVEQEVAYHLPRVEPVDRLREARCVGVLLGTKAEDAHRATFHHPMQLTQVLGGVVPEVDGVHREHLVEMGIGVRQRLAVSEAKRQATA